MNKLEKFAGFFKKTEPQCDYTKFIDYMYNNTKIAAPGRISGLSFKIKTKIAAFGQSDPFRTAFFSQMNAINKFIEKTKRRDPIIIIADYSGDENYFADVLYLHTLFPAAKFLLLSHYANILSIATISGKLFAASFGGIEDRFIISHKYAPIVNKNAGPGELEAGISFIQNCGSMTDTIAAFCKINTAPVLFLNHDLRILSDSSKFREFLDYNINNIAALGGSKANMFCIDINTEKAGQYISFNKGTLNIIPNGSNSVSIIGKCRSEIIEYNIADIQMSLNFKNLLCHTKTFNNLDSNLLLHFDGCFNCSLESKILSRYYVFEDCRNNVEEKILAAKVLTDLDIYFCPLENHTPNAAKKIIDRLNLCFFGSDV